MDEPAPEISPAWCTVGGALSGKVVRIQPRGHNHDQFDYPARDTEQESVCNQSREDLQRLTREDLIDLVLNLQNESTPGSAVDFEVSRNAVAEAVAAAHRATAAAAAAASAAAAAASPLLSAPNNGIESPRAPLTTAAAQQGSVLKACIGGDPRISPLAPGGTLPAQASGNAVQVQNGAPWPSKAATSSACVRAHSAGTPGGRVQQPVHMRRMLAAHYQATPGVGYVAATPRVQVAQAGGPVAPLPQQPFLAHHMHAVRTSPLVAASPHQQLPGHSQREGSANGAGGGYPAPLSARRSQSPVARPVDVPVVGHAASGATRLQSSPSPPPSARMPSPAVHPLPSAVIVNTPASSRVSLASDPSFVPAGHVAATGLVGHIPSRGNSLVVPSHTPPLQHQHHHQPALLRRVHMAGLTPPVLTGLAPQGLRTPASMWRSPVPGVRVSGASSAPHPAAAPGPCAVAAACGYGTPGHPGGIPLAWLSGGHGRPAQIVSPPGSMAVEQHSPTGAPIPAASIASARGRAAERVTHADGAENSDDRAGLLTSYCAVLPPGTDAPGQLHAGTPGSSPPGSPRPGLKWVEAWTGEFLDQEHNGDFVDFSATGSGASGSITIKSRSSKSNWDGSGVFCRDSIRVKFRNGKELSGRLVVQSDVTQLRWTNGLVWTRHQHLRGRSGSPSSRSKASTEKQPGGALGKLFGCHRGDAAEPSVPRRRPRSSCSWRRPPSAHEPGPPPVDDVQGDADAQAVPSSRLNIAGWQEHDRTPPTSARFGQLGPAQQQQQQRPPGSSKGYSEQVPVSVFHVSASSSGAAVEQAFARGGSTLAHCRQHQQHQQQHQTPLLVEGGVPTFSQGVHAAAQQASTPQQPMQFSLSLV